MSLSPVMKVPGQRSVVRGIKNLVNPSTLFRDEEKFSKKYTMVVLKIRKQKITG